MRLLIDLPPQALPAAKSEAQVRQDIHLALAFYWLARGELTAEAATVLTPAAASFKTWLSAMPDVGDDEDFTRRSDPPRSEVPWDI